MQVFKYDPDYSPAMQLFKKVKDFEKKKAKAVEAEAERDYHKAADFYIQALNVDASHRCVPDTCPCASTAYQRPGPLVPMGPGVGPCWGIALPVLARWGPRPVAPVVQSAC